jgi:integrase
LDIQTKGLIMARARRGRSEGSIYFRESDNRWVGSISTGYDGEGRRKRRIVYGATKKEVQDKIRELQGQAISGTLPDVTRLKLGAYLNRWLENTAKSKVHATSRERYEPLIRLHIQPSIGGIPLTKLTYFHVESFYADMERQGIGPRTRNMVGTLLTSALRQAVKSRLIPFNPAIDAAKPRYERKELQFWSEAQARLFLESTRDHRLYALFAVAIGSGMRQGELFALQWSDVDFEKGTIVVCRSLAKLKSGFILKEPKTKSSRRTIKLPRFALDALTRHRHAMLREGHIAASVFCAKTGQFLERSNFGKQYFKPLMSKANAQIVDAESKAGNEPQLLPLIRFHDLRHTHATTLLANGHSIKAVSQRLGHANVKVTLEVYMHVLPTDDAALADGLDRMFG